MLSPRTDRLSALRPLLSLSGAQDLIYSEQITAKVDDYALPAELPTLYTASPSSSNSILTSV